MSENIKHKIGSPRSVQGEDCYIYPIYDNETGDTFAHVYGLIPEQANKRAKLIAAAPAMLEALQDIVYSHNTKMGPSAVSLRIELAEQAIKEATERARTKLSG